MRAIVLALGASFADAVAPSCKSDSGSNVDFAYAFKYPGGWDYAYMDSDNKLAKSLHTLTSESSSISKTLMQLHSEDVNYVVWNDQPAPSGSSSSPTAHAKGALIFTSSGGLWLTQSLPKFPAISARSASGLWSDASDDFGQSYLCITLDADEIHKLSPVFAITRPVVYGKKISSSDEKTFSDIVEWAVDKKYDEDSMTTKATIKSKGGQSFTFFGKSGNWGKGKDLYRDLVAPEVGELDMEGWRRGAGVWGPACGKDEVLDILSVKYPEKSWDTMDDHSKWAVGKSGTVLCVGDINRADGQDKRGGGTVCIHDSSFASQMRDVIATTDKCSKTDTVQV